MALFHTTVVDNQIKALDTIGSASGSIATFDTDRAERLVNLEVAITATGGGGTPDNPIAINGFSNCNLSVNGTTETIPFGQTVYGGRLNVGSGVLTVTHGYVDLSTLTWNDSPSGYTYSDNLASVVKIYGGSVLNNIIAEKYQTNIATNIVNLAQNGIGVGGTGNIICRPQSPTGLCVYELETPFTIQLDSKQIQAIIGTNNIYLDTGDIIDLKFVLTVGQAIS